MGKLARDAAAALARLTEMSGRIHDRALQHLAQLGLAAIE